MFSLPSWKPPQAGLRRMYSKSSRFGLVSASRVQQSVECLLCLQRLPHIPNGSLGICAVETHCRNLLLHDPLFNVGTVYAGISCALMKEQVNLIRQDSGEVVDVRLPVAVKSRGENNPGVVIEDHEPQVVDCGDAIRVLLPLAGESVGQELAHPLASARLQLADKRELV